MEDVLIKVLNVMPTFFSSNEFAAEAKKIGYPTAYIQRGSIRMFLHKNCEQSEDSVRMWKKKDAGVTTIDDVQQAIILLKSQGYKVMKPKAGWEEL